MSDLGELAFILYRITCRCGDTIDCTHQSMSKVYDAGWEADGDSAICPTCLAVKTQAETTNEPCKCGHARGWHDPTDGHVGMCLWPNGWPDKRECKCDAFTPRLSPTGDDTP